MSSSVALRAAGSLSLDIVIDFDVGDVGKEFIKAFGACVLERKVSMRYSVYAKWLVTHHQ